MKHYDVLFIGWGKANKTLARHMAKQGKSLALVEQDRAMAGGTCINIACIPTKTLILEAEKGSSFDEAMSRRKVVVEKLNEANYKNLATEDTVDIIFGQASFISNYEVLVSSGDQAILLNAKEIYINTGSEPRWPDLPNIKDIPQVYDSTTLQQLKIQAENLAIVGAGPIGLEFATIYQKLGTKVTVFESNAEILKREEPEIRQTVLKLLTDEGIKIICNSNINEVKHRDTKVDVIHDSNQVNTFDAVLFATGRQPAIRSLKLENTDIELNDRQGIKTNEHLETTVANVFALGDVRGEEQFTYISLDDSRIITNQYSLKDRKHIPYSIFIDPVLSRVGLTEARAKEQGFQTRINVIPVSKMPRAHVNNDLRGLFKAVINKENGQILGASLLGQNSEEIINIIKLAMDHKVPASALANQVFTHPTMAENLNDLFL